MSIDRMIIRVAVGIVAVVLVLAVVLRADEVESIASVEIGAPPDVVWAMLTDPDQRHRWMESVTGATQTMGAYGAASSSMILSVKQDGKLHNIYEDVTTAAPPLLLHTAIDDPDGVLSLRTAYELKPAGPGGIRTRLKITAIRGLDGILAPFFAVVVQQRSDENVEYNARGLKMAVESDYLDRDL